MSTTRDLANVLPGHELRPFSRAATLHHWNRYAAVNDEFYDIHMDDAAGVAAGYSGAIGMGNLQFAYITNMLEAWLGNGGRVTKVACQFRGASLRDRTLTARGVVASIEDKGPTRAIELDVWTEDDGGERLARGTARVEVFQPA